MLSRLRRLARLFADVPRRSDPTEFLRERQSRVPGRQPSAEEVLEDVARQQDELRGTSDSKAGHDPTRSTISMFGFAALALGTLYAIQRLNQTRDSARENRRRFGKQNAGRADIGGPWRLTDRDGRDFGSADLSGDYYIIYFGFCNCPDVCPASLSKLAKALNLARGHPEARHFRLRVVFVSVDPDRDSPARVARFAAHYHPDFEGVTAAANDAPDLQAALKSFRIHVSRIDFETPNERGELERGYSFDHSVVSYLMGPDGRFLTHLGSSLGSRDLADTIVDSVLEDLDARKFAWKQDASAARRTRPS